MMTVADVLEAVHAAAPAGQAADWDAVGLHVGDPSAAVTRVLVALDLTPAVVAEAASLGAEVVLTHHPLLFTPPKRVTTNDAVGAIVWSLARHGIAAIAAHTNLDAATDGVSVALADQLGLDDVRILAPLPEALVKITTYVPHADADAVRAAMAHAGAGQIGAYQGCSFSTHGEGRFTPLDGAAPAVGAVGTPEVVSEARVEAVVPRWRADAVRHAIAEAHPYEEPATEVAPLLGGAAREGFGAIGTLPQPEGLATFLLRVCERLEQPSLRYAGRDETRVSRVAVCGGSGLSFLPSALAAGADAYVTADVTYHRWFEALGPQGDPRLVLVDAGHYETERVAEHLLAQIVARACPGLSVITTQTRTSPVRSFTR